jgi:FkbM family methyltransferase
VVDVGAHTGKSALELSSAFPSARIYAVEPIAASFDELETNVAGHERVVARRTALADVSAPGVLKVGSPASTSKLVSPDRTGTDYQPVALETGDDFCRANGLDHVGFLKVDTVGNDFRVIRGFHEMLGRQRIDLLQIEAGLFSHGTAREPLDRFRGYLEPLGYEIFGIYSASRGYKGLPVLTRAEIVFISMDAAEQNLRVTS